MNFFEKYKIKRSLAIERVHHFNLLKCALTRSENLYRFCTTKLLKRNIYKEYLVLYNTLIAKAFVQFYFGGAN